MAPDVLAGVVLAWMFNHKNISAGTLSRPANVPLDGHFNTGTFQHGDISARDISAPEHFGTWIFWHLAKEYGHFDTEI